MSDATNTQWGRVGEDGTVYVRDGETERAVGQYPDSTTEEALAYFTRKYSDLEGQVTLLEARINRGTAGDDVTKSVRHLQEQLREPAAVGDLQALRDRVAKLVERADEFSEQQKEARAQARAAAIAEREALVAEAERLADQPVAQIHWRNTQQAFRTLFDQWQAAQRRGPHIPKSQADQLWKRFRDARHRFDHARRAHFKELDQRSAQVEAKKEKLIAAAEALAPKGAAGVPDYRRLLDEWKQAGRSRRKTDDQLWARFKAAGDVLFGELAAEQAALDEQYRDNLVQKEALLDDAESLLSETDHQKAREALTKVQLKWDEIGRVPRDSMRTVEDRLRKIESHVKQLEDAHWRETDPETKARSEGLRAQLEQSIAALEAEVAAASSDKERETAQAALETQKSWLAALGE